MNAPRFLRRVAMAGAVAVAIVGPRAAGLAILALMLAPAVIVPLGLSLALEAKHLPRAVQRFLGAFLVLAPLGALVTTISWFMEPWFATLAASAHAVTCFAAGILGLARLFARREARFAPLHEFAIDVGLLLLPVAGVWFFASRVGVSLAGFHEPVVTFTAAHFHYAGFAAPIVIGGAGRVLFADDDKGPRRLYRVAALVVCAGVPLTAIGILTNHTIEAAGAVFLALGMLCACVVLVVYVSRRAYPISRAAAVLYVVSGLVLLLTMSLAMTFALTSSAGRGANLHAGPIAIQTMIDFHGAVNAFGFALSGLVANAMIASQRETSSKTPS